ncbi:MAG: hypothetical protein M3332_03015 [Actinomycetota bacterium]|nr:hypothetical protein [Actinomycetota bacterium]
MDPVRLGHRPCDIQLRDGLLLTGWARYAGGVLCLLLGVLLLNREELVQQLTPGVSPTVQDRRQPDTGQAGGLACAVVSGRNGIVLVRRLDCRPATTSRRAAESGTGQADHRTVEMSWAPRVVIHFFHGRAE